MQQMSTPNGAAGRRRQWIRFAVKAGITLFIFWLLLRQMDLGSVIDQALTVDQLALAGAFILSLLMVSIAGLRWFFVIKSIGHYLSLATIWRLTLIGAFFNQVLPSAMGGDLVRFPYAHKAGMPLKAALKSVVLDRLLAFVGLILLAALCILLAFGIVPSSVLYQVLLGVIAVGLLGIGLLLSVGAWPERLLKMRPARIAHAMIRSVRAVLTSRFRTKVLLSAVSVHVVRILTVYLLAVGMSIPVSLIHCLILVPLALLVTALPFSVGGWGLREGAFVVAFAAVDVAPEQSFALSALFGMVTLVSSLAGAMVWMFERVHAGNQ